MSQTPDLEHWRAELREWLARTLPRASGDDRAWGRGEPDFAVFRNLSEDAERALLDEVRTYRRARYDAGYGALTLPVDKGGQALPPIFAVAFTQEEAGFAPPASTELISVTTRLVGPAVALFGTQAQRAEFAAPMLRTDRLACQLFSEPGAGSELAALACRAVRAGDGWVLDGQKVWTSGARFADYGMLLA